MKSATQLQAALRRGVTIEQAKGIVMAMTDCDAEEAFATLEDRAGDKNRDVADIAAEIVERQGTK